MSQIVIPDHVVELDGRQVGSALASCTIRASAARSRSISRARLWPVIVLVPGYSGPLSGVVDRWRIGLAMATLDRAGGGSLVVSGYRGEAERLAELVPDGVEMVIEPAARSTWENVERSLVVLRDADSIAIATDFFHARRAQSYLRRLDHEVASRVVPAHRRWPRGLWMDVAGALDVLRRRARRAG